MKKVFREILNAIVYSNLVIATGAYCISLITIDDLKLKGIDELPLLIFFSTLFAYSYQRQVKIRFVYDKHTNDRAAWMNKRALFNLFMIIISVVGMAFTVSISEKLILYTSPFALIVLGYILPSKTMGLRNIPFLKIFLISSIWMYVTVLLPYLMNTESIETSQLIQYSIVRFLFMLGITIPFDIRDLGIDAETMRTIPQVFGINGAKIVGILVLLLTMFLSLISQIVDFSYIITAAAAIVLILLTNTKRSDLFYLGLIDGLMIFWYIIKITLQ